MILAALAVAFFWAVEGIDVNAPQFERVAILVSAIALGWAALRHSPLVAFLTCWLAVLVAISERMRREPLLDGSDVLRATTEALGIVAQGGNPYASFLHSTIPPGSPLVYPPGELAWYALPQWLFGDIPRVDTWAGVLIVVATVVAGLRLRFHAELWGTNLLHALAQLGDPAPLVPLFAFVEIVGTLVLLVIVATRWNAPSLGAAVLLGAGLVLVPLLFAKWTTQPYYAYIGGVVVCGLALLSLSRRARPATELPDA